VKLASTLREKRELVGGSCKFMTVWLYLSALVDISIRNVMNEEIFKCCQSGTHDAHNFFGRIFC
jgi:hypothetical protein